MNASTCGVCGQELAADFFEPPTYSLVKDELGRAKPVLSKPIRVDPETGAVCWCQQPEAVAQYERLYTFVLNQVGAGTAIEAGNVPAVIHDLVMQLDSLAYPHNLGDPPTPGEDRATALQIMHLLARFWVTNQQAERIAAGQSD